MEVQTLTEYGTFLTNKQASAKALNKTNSEESEILSRLGALMRVETSARDVEAIYGTVDEFCRKFTSEGVPGFVDHAEWLALEIDAQDSESRATFAETQLESVIFHQLDRYRLYLDKLNKPVYRGDRKPLHLTGSVFLPLLKFLKHIPDDRRRPTRVELLNKVNALCPDHPLVDR